MPKAIIYSVGSVATWAALVFFYLFVRDFMLLFGKRVSTISTGSVITKGVSALVLFLLGVVWTAPFSKEGFKLPIFWYVMPWSAWIATGLFAFALWRLGKTLTSLTSSEKIQDLRSAGIAAFVGAGMILLYKQDADNKINVLTGGIPLSIGVIGFIAALFILSMISIAWGYNSLRGRGITKVVATQAALVMGSVVFGLPFVFLLITSFKEDRDMSAKSGIIWVPRVTETVPYVNPDPKKKHYIGKYNGREVEAVSVSEENGKMKMDIFRPLSIRGIAFYTTRDQLREVPIDANVYTTTIDGQQVKGFEKESLEDGRKILQILEPEEMKDKEVTVMGEKAEPVRHIGLRTQNYTEAIQYLPIETSNGLVYLKNTLILVIMGVIGTILSCSIVAYSFSRLKFPGKDKMFNILLATMMLPGAVTMLPQFLIYRTLGWVDSLYPLWVPAFFGSAFNIFLLRQFFSQIPMELEDAAKIDGCSYLRTFWDIMLPQIKPALAVIAVGTFLGAWNNFMGPLIYINSPEHMPISYALQLFKGDRDGDSEPGLLMAFTSMTVVPVVGVFFFAQKYFIEGVTLSGLGGR